MLRAFVGKVSTEVCNYIWDQCVMLRNFDRLIPNFAVALLISLREALLSSASPQQMLGVLTTQGPNVSQRKMQTLSERLFMDQLRDELGIARSSASDLYELIDSEEQMWNEGVAGLDQSLDWTSFAKGSRAGAVPVPVPPSRHSVGASARLDGRCARVARDARWRAAA